MKKLYSREDIENLLDNLQLEAEKEHIHRAYRSGLWYAQNLIEAMIKNENENGGN